MHSKTLTLSQIMGSNYVNQEAFNPKHIMDEATSSTPIFFILFPGYSPSKEIEQFANRVSERAVAYIFYLDQHV
mgnify:CR=1 FL=1